MAEKHLWKDLKNNFKSPGRIERLEAKGMEGWSDVIGAIKGKALFIELKAISSEYAACSRKDFPWGLTGVQALNAYEWAISGCLAVLVVGFGPDHSDIRIYKGERLLDFITDMDEIRNAKTSSPRIPEADHITNKRDFWPLIERLLNV